MRTVSIAGFAAALALFRGASAAPSPQPFVVSIDPSSTCPEVESFANRLRERSPHLRPAIGAEPFIRYTVAAGAAGSGYDGRLRIAEPDGHLTERVVSGDTCAGVVDALALIAAILAEQRVEAVTPAPHAGRAPAANPPPADDRPRHTGAESPFLLGFGTTVGINSATGPTMPLGPGGDIAVSYRSETQWAPELRVSALTRGTSHVSKEAGEAAFRWWAIRLLASPVRWPSRGALSLRPMAGVELGQLTGWGDRTDDPNEAIVPWRAIDLGAISEVQWFGPLSVTGEACLVLPLRRDDFYFDTPDGRVSAFSAGDHPGFSARVGLVVRIP
ncbi:MAG: hypothetical protein JW751_26850 [Polyangiaceae bacterium]|nr:hypothetical protein [Polyangiaceae bacterium]